MGGSCPQASQWKAPQAPAAWLLRWGHVSLWTEAFKEGWSRGDRGTENIEFKPLALVGSAEAHCRPGVLMPCLAQPYRPILPLKDLPSSLGPLEVHVLRELPINATVSQDSGPGLAAREGRGRT